MVGHGWHSPDFPCVEITGYYLVVEASPAAVEYLAPGNRTPSSLLPVKV